ncbi:MAG: TonB-dependent receptor [Ignavibacteriaceae bacterium]|jgi:outer membrane cobalamin receptor
MIIFNRNSVVINNVIHVLIVVLLLSGLGFGQAVKNDSVKTYLLDPVVVTGTRYQLSKSQISSSITVVNNQEIRENHDVNVIRVLNNKVPGLFLNDNYVMGFGVGASSAGTINIRGIGGSPNTQVLVLIDGQPQFMGMFGHPIIDALTSSSVQRVEVIRGPASILYGSNAMGGAINIISKRIPDNKLAMNLTSFYGSYNSLNAVLDGGYQNKKFGFYVSINSSKTDGHREDSKDSFRNSTGFAKINYLFNDQLSLSLDGNISKAKFYDPGPVYAVTPNSYYNYLRSRGALSLYNSFKQVNGALRFYYSYGNHNFFDGWHSYDIMNGITFYQNVNFSKGLIFTGGIDYKNYGGKGTNANIPFLKGLGTYYSNNETAVYGLVRDSLFRNLNVEAGLRYSKNSLFKAVYTPQFGITYSPVKTTTLKATVGEGFQNPTIVDLYLFPVANANLKPEHIWNYEAGIEQKLFDYRLELELTAYYDEGDNIIMVTPPFFIKNNAGSFIHKGIEFQGKYLITNNFDASVNYSYLNTNNPTLYAPKHNLNIQLGYNYRNIQILLNLNQISGLYSNIQKSLKQNYFLADLIINYRLLNSIELFAKGENLLDKQYEINDGYPMPGRTIIAGVKLTY